MERQGRRARERKVSEFDARIAEHQQAIAAKYDAMRLAASENRGADYERIKRDVRELRQALYSAQETGRWADGVSRENAHVRVHTGELQVGDVVLTYGMRVRIDAIQEHKDEGTHGGVFWSSDGTVTNLDEVKAAGVVPPSWLCTEKFVEGQGWTTDRNDRWNVQGNDLATWTVVREIEAEAELQA
jgi:hypothetical protein